MNRGGEICVIVTVSIDLNYVHMGDLSAEKCAFTPGLNQEL